MSNITPLPARRNLRAVEKPDLYEALKLSPSLRPESAARAASPSTRPQKDGIFYRLCDAGAHLVQVCVEHPGPAVALVFFGEFITVLAVAAWELVR